MKMLSRIGSRVLSRGFRRWHMEGVPHLKRLSQLDDKDITPSMIIDAFNIVLTSSSTMSELKYKPNSKIHGIYKTLLQEDKTKWKLIPLEYHDHMMRDLDPKYITPEVFDNIPNIYGLIFNEYFGDKVGLFIITDKDGNSLPPKYNGFSTVVVTDVYKFLKSYNYTKACYYYQVRVDSFAKLTRYPDYIIIEGGPDRINVIGPKQSIIRINNESE